MKPWKLALTCSIAAVVAVACGGNGGHVPAVCSTGKGWSGGDEGSPMMSPGGNCIQCHARGEGPRFQIAGTVMGDYHDDDDCYGTGGVTVEITGADNKVLTLTTNESGNFFSKTAVATPFRARVVKDGKERKMNAPQSDGNCMNCHDAKGSNAAPGRIVAP